MSTFSIEELDIIQKIMKEKKCSRHEAESRFISAKVHAAQVAMIVPMPKPLPQQPIEEPQIEESVPEDQIAEQKQRILDHIENTLDEEDATANILGDEGWRNTINGFVNSLNALISNHAQFFVLTAQKDGGKILFKTQFYNMKDGKPVQVTPSEIYVENPENE